MRLAINNDHRRFFRTSGYITLEKLLTEEEAKLLQEEALRLHGGNDLWRRSPLFAKYSRHKRFARIVSSLVQTEPIRLVADMMLPQSHLSESAPLTEIFGFEGLVGALLLTIASPLAEAVGSGLFFSPEHLLDYKKRDSSYLIVYGKKRTLYRPTPKNLLLFSLREYDYVDGETLRDAENPLL